MEIGQNSPFKIKDNKTFSPPKKPGIRSFIHKITEYTPGLTPEQRAVKSVREVGRVFACFAQSGLPLEMSGSLRDVVHAYATYENTPQSAFLCNDFHEGGKYAQELYRHGARARLMLMRFADTERNIVLMRGKRTEDPRKTRWPETVRSYTSSPQTAEQFARGRLWDYDPGWDTKDWTSLPEDSPVEVRKIKVEDIVDVIGYGLEEEFLVLDRDLIPPSSIRKIFAAGKARFFKKPEE